jgi:dihydrofolate reductase
MTRRKIILNLAISLDGYISKDNGGFDWIKGDGDKSNDTKKQFDFSKFIDSIDIIVMGRKAYEDCPVETMESFKSKKIYVATSQKLTSKYDNVNFIKGDIFSQMSKLKGENGKDIWLFGGSGLTDPFIKADGIDKYIIGVIPIILGKGRKLFLDNNPIINLHLIRSTVQEGIAVLEYSKK